ncbi:MAG: chromosome segregation protein SMC [Planctomycetota bacterium]|nr:chromosome segregation protein SMC [Planctomycetota bacterium]
MRLAKLTVAGFKSFADPTEFVFDEPTIGIVGPNGCGKSNVVDAIKWVLGERSAKSLRGSAMLDVIFAGSASRKPMGGASVTLTFENPVGECTEEDASGGVTTTSRRALPVDTEEVDVTRRLFSDGKSEYLINGNKVRLRDIKELFLDTGIGTNAYSIIEQGKVDAMLLANPVERRAILEEAAGVAKFRTRKVESARKLEHAERNLLIVREQLSNTERRLRIVRGQAEKAQKYSSLEERRRDLLTSVFLERFHSIHENLHGLTSQIAEANEERKRVHAEVEQLEEVKQAAEIERHRLQEDQHAQEQRRLELQSRETQATQRGEMTRRNLEEATQQLEQEENRIREYAESLETLTTEAGTLDEAVRELGEAIERSQQEVGRAEQARTAAAEAAARSRAEVDRLRDGTARLERDIVGAEGHLQSIAERERALQDQITRLESRLTPFQRELDQHQVELNRCRNEHLVASDELRSLDAMHLEQTRITEDLDDQQASLLERLGAMREERSAKRSRQHLLEEMHREREGLGDAVRKVLERPDDFRGVHGLLGDLIETDRDHADLVECALGDDLQALLVDDTNHIDPLLGEMRQLDGRLVLLPVHPASSTPRPPAPRVPGATPLLSMIKAEGPARIVIERLLWNTWLVDGLETARELARGPLAGGRFVTHSGERFDPEDRLVIAPTAREGAAHGWLARKAELRELSEHLVASDREVAELESSLASVEAESGSALQQQMAVASKMEEARAQVIETTHQVERIEQLIERVKRDRLSIEQERDELQSRFNEIHEAEAEQRDRLASLNRLLEEQKVTVIAGERTAREHANAAERAGEQLSDARITHGEVNANLESTRRERRQSTLAREEAERQVAIGREQLERRQAQTARFRQTITAAEREVAEVTSELASMSSAFAEFAQRSDRAGETLAKAAESLHAARARGSTVERDVHALEMARREQELKRENLEERSIEELELDLADTYPEHRDQRGGEEFQPVDLHEAEAEAAEIKEQIRKLGNVNLDAVEELDALQVRNEGLENQLADIDAAREQLTTLIEELDTISRERFKETFETVRENFAGSGGMFRKLFGGGSADLFLMPDENGETDWLESGVEIRAKPPGKEPRVINQLSGGEKTMTAVALLMAIFKSKPSPFCILDEVDAALDEANVERFCAVVQQFLDRSHFIVITHHKTTMRMCDKLYGVTMPQRGVSRRVSVRFDEVNEQGEIAPEAADRLDPDPPALDAAPSEPPLLEVERMDATPPARANLLSGAWDGDRPVAAEPDTSEQPERGRLAEPAPPSE